MCGAALALGIIVPLIDARVGDEWIERFAWLYANKPDGARELLSTVAGSMIGVAGITFSIVIVAIAHAAAQHGPRLLTNFLRDRGNQFTLGTFLGTFLYSLVVLQTVSGVEDGDAEIFVPHIALLVSLGMALASIGVLIYFIHHTAQSIHVSNVVAGIGRSLISGVEDLFPMRIGEPPAPQEVPPSMRRDSSNGEERNLTPDALPDGFFDDACPVRADSAGYIEAIDVDGLLTTAVKHDLVLRLHYRPGDFVSEGKTLVLASPADHVSEQVQKSIRRSFAWGRRRTPVQDIPFLADELAEIAIRSMSPSINDPRTAMSCLDWLGAALGRIAGHTGPSGIRYDDSHQIRVVAEPSTFDQFAEAAFGQVRQYMRTDRNASLHMLKVMAEVAQFASPEQRATLRRHADALLEGCETGLGQETDRQQVRARHRTLLRILTGRAPFDQESSRTPWLTGSG